VEAFMANTLKLPVGIDDFRKLRESHFYYVDKTRLIEQLLLNWSEVTLFTRPRRFGKTLNMSMLKSFFDIGTDKTLFDGLYISGNKELCDEYMGKYPVIFLSLKGVEGLTYEEAFEAFVRIMGKEVNRVSFLADSDKLTQIEREQYKGLTIIKNGRLAFDKEKLISSLQLLSQLLYKHYGKKVVILIDEYDVPLDKAFQNGYYNEMVSLIRGLFGQALKTNEFLPFSGRETRRRRADDERNGPIRGRPLGGLCLPARETPPRLLYCRRRSQSVEQPGIRRLGRCLYHPRRKGFPKNHCGRCGTDIK
jgi:hypothetical protein